jgi:hypothetical protein
MTEVQKYIPHITEAGLNAILSLESVSNQGGVDFKFIRMDLGGYDGVEDEFLDSADIDSACSAQKNHFQLSASFQDITKSYSVYEIGLYIQTPQADQQAPQETLFAVYRDPYGDVIAEKLSDNELTLLYDVVFTGGSDPVIIYPCNSELEIGYATESTLGIVQFATNEEIDQGINDYKIVSSDGVVNKLSQDAKAEKIPLSNDFGFIDIQWLADNQLHSDHFQDMSITNRVLSTASITAELLQDKSINIEKTSTPKAFTLPLSHNDAKLATDWLEGVETIEPSSFTHRVGAVSTEHSIPTLRLHTDDTPQEARPTITHIHTQAEFESVFGDGTSVVVIPANSTILLSPLQQVETGNIKKGAWGGIGDNDENTFNGSPAYILKNEVQLNSHTSITGFNTQNTIIVKNAPGCRFTVNGTDDQWIQHLYFDGWSFDGRGGVSIFSDVNLQDTLETVGGYILEDKNGGAFYLNYCRHIVINCYLVNHKTTGKGGAIYCESAEVIPELIPTMDALEPDHYSNCEFITALHISHCQANQGGGVYQGAFTQTRVADCLAVTDELGHELAAQGGGVARLQYGISDIQRCQVIANSPSSDVESYSGGGGAAQCSSCVLTISTCKALGNLSGQGITGGGAILASYSIIEVAGCSAESQAGGFVSGGGCSDTLFSDIYAHRCTSVHGAGAYYCDFCKIKSLSCNADETGGAIEDCYYITANTVNATGNGAYVCNYLVAYGQWSLAENASGDLIVSESNSNWHGTFAYLTTAIDTLDWSTDDVLRTDVLPQ